MGVPKPGPSDSPFLSGGGSWIREVEALVVRYRPVLITERRSRSVIALSPPPPPPRPQTLQRSRVATRAPVAAARAEPIVEVSGAQLIDMSHGAGVDDALRHMARWHSLRERAVGWLCGALLVLLWSVLAFAKW